MRITRVTFAEAANSSFSKWIEDIVHRELVNHMMAHGISTQTISEIVSRMGDKTEEYHGGKN